MVSINIQFIFICSFHNNMQHQSGQYGYGTFGHSDDGTTSRTSHIEPNVHLHTYVQTYVRTNVRTNTFLNQPQGVSI